MTFHDLTKPPDWLYEDDLFFIIRDRHPVSPGHLLVISRRTARDFFDLTDAERAGLPEAIRKARDIIESEYSPAGYNIGMNCGSAAGQTVIHFHCHVIPRYAGDVPDPRGGVRHCVPGKGFYPSGEGFPRSPAFPVVAGNGDAVHSIKVMYKNEIRCITSMAVRGVLAELSALYEGKTGVRVILESVGGVDAVRRIRAGESFDAAFLASGAVEELMASGHLRSCSRTDLFRSPAAAAVRQGAHKPDISTPEALRRAVLGAVRLSYSTGPSGRALERLFSGWGIGDTIRDRLVVPPPGIPVGELVARGEADLGFQQLSELLDVPGIAVLGTLPPELGIVTIFSAALPRGADPGRGAGGFLDFLASPETDAAKGRHGMESA